MEVHDWQAAYRSWLVAEEPVELWPVYAKAAADSWLGPSGVALLRSAAESVDNHRTEWKP